MSPGSTQTINGVLSLDFVEGSPAVLRRLTDREAVADEAWADSKGLGVGDTVSVRTPLEKRAIYTIRGEIEGGLDLFGKMLVNDVTLDPLFGADQPSLAFVRLEHELPRPWSRAIWRRRSPPGIPSRCRTRSS